jgi:2-polyprenyl-3-methyl-5-hydroxy-6-metoxy-1,4-benzoquinol methylase
MSANPQSVVPAWSSDEGARWYDRSIDWSARLSREIPVLSEVFGPPTAGGLLDAGCGTGHQASAMARLGYRVVGADASESMLSVGRQIASKENTNVRWVRAAYAELCQTVGAGFDGVYCLGNSLAASGSRAGVRAAVEQFGKCLRPGGKLFIQVLNFERMRNEIPCVQGPRVTNVEGSEYVSVRQFHFVEDWVQVTNITVWSDNGWHQRSHAGRLYPVTPDELRAWCHDAGIRCAHAWGGYAREAFSIDTSIDLIFVGSRS